MTPDPKRFPKPHKLHLLILLVVAVACLGVGSLYGRHQERAQTTVLNLAPPPLASAPVEEETKKEPAPLFVHVKGAVENQGLYQLPADSRVGDVLDEAGLLETANIDIVNLAEKLVDGMEIIVPFRVEDEETDWLALAQSRSADTLNAGAGGAANSGAANSGPVNINTANQAQLETLTGIGPAKAQAIIAYREQHGPFGSIEDIKKVSGIGSATFDKIKDRLVVE